MCLGETEDGSRINEPVIVVWVGGGGGPGGMGVAGVGGGEAWEAGGGGWTAVTE